MSTVVHRGPGRSGAGGRSRLSLLLLVVCVGVATAAAAVAAGLSSPGRSSALPALGSPSLQLPDGGTVEVLAVTPELLAHTPGMPAAMMPGDPMPADVRRVTVQVALTAGPDGLPFAGGDFRLGPPEVAGSAPERDGVGEGTLAPGYRMDGELVFRVPVSADALVLTEARSGRTVDVTVADAADADDAADETADEDAAPEHGHTGSAPSAATSPAPSHQHGSHSAERDAAGPASPATATGPDA